MPSEVCFSTIAFDFSTISSIASSQLASCNWPSRRISGRVRRSGLSLATQPCRPLGPRRPLLVASVARPRTPTILSALTPMSRPQPLEHSTHVPRTHRSGVSVTRSSTRTGHSCPGPCGVRSPQISLMLLRVSLVITSPPAPLIRRSRSFQMKMMVLSAFSTPLFKAGPSGGHGRPWAPRPRGRGSPHQPKPVCRLKLTRWTMRVERQGVADPAGLAEGGSTRHSHIWERPAWPV